MKSRCCNFTHPLTPSREGRGEQILKSFARVLKVVKMGRLAGCARGNEKWFMKRCCMKRKRRIG